MKLATTLQYLGRPVTFFPQLARFLGSIEAAVLLQQLCYWKDKTTHEYLYTTAKDIEEQTALNVGQQRRARKILEAFGIVSSKYARLNHETHYLVNLDELENRWVEWVKAGAVRRTKRPDIKRTSKGRFKKRHVPYTDFGNTVNGASGKPYTVRRDIRKRCIDSIDFPKNSHKNSPNTPPQTFPKGTACADPPQKGVHAAVHSLLLHSSKTVRDSALAREGTGANGKGKRREERTPQEQAEYDAERITLLAKQERQLAAQGAQHVTTS